MTVWFETLTLVWIALIGWATGEVLIAYSRGRRMAVQRASRPARHDGPGHVPGEPGTVTHGARQVMCPE